MQSMGLARAVKRQYIRLKSDPVCFMPKWQGVVQRQISLQKLNSAELERKALGVRRATMTLLGGVGGGQKGAVEGTLSIMVGGSKEALDRALPLFEVLGKNIVHMGEIGRGQMTKTVQSSDLRPLARGAKGCKA